MKKNVSYSVWIIFFATIICIAGFYWKYPGGVKDIVSNKKLTAEDYKITIFSDSSSKSTMPPAFFPHEKHVTVTTQMGFDCRKCHENNDLPDVILDTSFISNANLNSESLKIAYHEKCINCHIESNNIKAPLEASCNTCHVRLTN